MLWHWAGLEIQTNANLKNLPLVKSTRCFESFSFKSRLVGLTSLILNKSFTNCNASFKKRTLTYNSCCTFKCIKVFKLLYMWVGGGGLMIFIRKWLIYTMLFKSLGKGISYFLVKRFEFKWICNVIFRTVKCNHICDSVIHATWGHTYAFSCSLNVMPYLSSFFHHFKDVYISVNFTSQSPNLHDCFHSLELFKCYRVWQLKV